MTAEAVTDCAQFATESVAGGEYNVQTNEWNSTQTQCVSINGASFDVTQASFNLATNGPPATYPSIYKGCHWGNCTSSSGLPVKVASMPAVTTSWSTTETSGAYDVAYDIWFNQTPTTSGQPNGAELMIWINESGAQPAGSVVGTAQIAGATWNVWKAAMSSWTYVAYVRSPAVSSISNVDIHAFTEDSVSRGYINSSWYLIDVEAGFEIWQGGQGLAVNSFSVEVGGGTSSSSSSGSSSGSSSSGSSGTGTVHAALSLQSSWSTGYCDNLTVTNSGSSAISTWQVALNTNQSALYNSWNANFGGNAPSYTVTPLSWNASIPAGGSQTVGFCANDTGSNATPTVTSVSGK
jgi:cellulose 1,4-beta-cellobiosidase